MQLKDKVALITGGTNGIGAAIAKRFSAEGARVIVTGSRPETVAAVDYAEAIVSDAGDSTAVKDLLKFTGPLDILVVNAGIARRSRISEVSEYQFDEQFRVNVRGPFFLLQDAAPLMNPGGSIILISSLAALRGMPDVIVYSATKGALASMGRALAMELAPQRVRVNIITPSGIATSIRRKMGDLGDIKVPPTYPLGRFGSADDIVGAAMYFASDDSLFTTGSELIIDGGNAALGRV